MNVILSLSWHLQLESETNKLVKTKLQEIRFLNDLSENLEKLRV
jgi:hypothetical protein